MGGGCDSVGVSGCWLGGCYNVFTKKFGDGATNLLQVHLPPPPPPPPPPPISPETTPV